MKFIDYISLFALAASNDSALLGEQATADIIGDPDGVPYAEPDNRYSHMGLKVKDDISYEIDAKLAFEKK